MLTFMVACLTHPWLIECVSKGYKKCAKFLGHPVEYLEVMTIDDHGKHKKNMCVDMARLYL